MILNNIENLLSLRILSIFLGDHLSLNRVTIVLFPLQKQIQKASLSVRERVRDELAATEAIKVHNHCIQRLSNKLFVVNGPEM